MAEVVQNPDVKNARTLEDALELLAQYPRGSRTGLLVVTSAQFEGVVSIQEGRIIGISAAGITQVDSALTAFFNITAGEFQFTPTTDNMGLANHNLWIEPISKLNEIRYGLIVPKAEANDPIFELMDSSLPDMTEQQMQLLDQLKQFRTDSERDAFLHQCEELKQLQDDTSLTSDQLMLLATYKQLSSYDDRSEFLEEVPEFAEIFKDTWSANHRAEFEKVRATYFKLPQFERMAFLQKNPYFAELYKEKSYAEDFRKLKAQYNTLSTEEEREQFLQSNPEFMQAMLNDEKLTPEQKLQLQRLASLAKQAKDETFDEHHPLLNDNMVVLREEDLEAAKQQLALEASLPPGDLDLAALDAIPAPDNKLLIASDHFEIEESEEEKRRRMRRYGSEDLEEKPPKWWQKISHDHMTWAMSALIFAGVLAAGNMFLSSHRLSGNPNEDMQAMEEILVTAIKGDLPTNHLDLYQNFITQSAAGSSGGGGSSGGSGLGMVRMGFQRDYIQIDKLMSEGKFAEAAGVCRSVLKRDIRNARARLALIKSLMSLQQWTEARGQCIAGMKLAASADDARQFEDLLRQVGWTDPAAPAQQAQPTPPSKQ